MELKGMGSKEIIEKREMDESVTRLEFILATGCLPIETFHSLSALFMHFSKTVHYYKLCHAGSWMQQVHYLGYWMRLVDDQTPTTSERPDRIHLYPLIIIHLQK